uniref:Polycomb protein esc n=1 Tax=Psoroptes ovis TaxID=83912 RepID=A0A3B0QNZ1_PSOOV|nr:polycomb protein esc [Psoroptes ovis]
MNNLLSPKELELGRQVVKILKKIIYDDENNVNSNLQKEILNEKFYSYYNFVRTFLDFNKDSFFIDLNQLDLDIDSSSSNESEENFNYIDDNDDDDSSNSDEETMVRMKTRSTSRMQQSSSSAKQHTIKKKIAKKSVKKAKQQNDAKPTTTKLSTNKFLIDFHSSIMLKLNSSLFDPQFPVMYGVAFNPFCYPDNIFAVCGKSIVIAYQCLSYDVNEQDDSCEGKGLQSLFAHSDRNDSYYCCCWTYDIKRPNRSYLCFAGERGVIRIIDVKKQLEIKTFYGHGAAINDMKICPSDPTLLLSASKDSGIRLWNIHTNTLIAIFGGVQGHRDEVVAIDFHRSRNLFVSVSIDHSIKIWSLCHHEVFEAIKLSRDFIPDINGRQFDTVSQHFPNYSTRDVHHNYIDSVQWFGDLLITKSCDEKLVVWKPGTENGTLDDIEKRTYYSDFASHGSDSYGDETLSTNVVIIRRFNLDRNNIWFVRFSFDLNEFLLAVGNLNGHLFIYDFKHFNSNDYRLAFEIPVPQPRIDQQQSKKLNFNINVNNNNKMPLSRVIRQTAFNSDDMIYYVLQNH